LKHRHLDAPTDRLVGEEHLVIQTKVTRDVTGFVDDAVPYPTILNPGH